MFADAFASGEIAFFATIDYSGRGFFGHVSLIRKVDGDFVRSEVNSDSAIDVDSLAGRVVDLDHDGVSEIVVPRPLADYSGHEPIPFFPEVFLGA